MADSSTFEHPAETLLQLSALGIPVKTIEESLLDGHHGRASCSALHPQWFGGSHQYADIVQGLRLRLIPLGWTASEVRGFATIVSPDESFQVAVSSADAQVGREGSPRTKNPKGAATVYAIERNKEQRKLFGTLPIVLPPRNIIKPSGRTTWFLLYHQTNTEIWFELSLPKSMGLDGRPNDWAVRLKFAPIKLGATPTPTPDSTPTKHVVEVTRL